MIDTQNTIKQIQTRQAQKIKELKRRQEKREKDGLYHSSSVEGEDYIICPIANVRFTKIKKNHITSTLGITEDEYYEMFPELKGKVADRLKKRISQGLKTKLAYYEDGSPVLDDNGTHITGGKWGRMKSSKILNSIDPETGKRRYDMLGEKTRNSHLKNVDENGLNGYQRIAKDAIHKGNATKLKNGVMSRTWTYPFERYERMVEYLLKYVKPALTNNGKISLSKVTDVDDGLQIDHKYSIVQGWNDKISPFVIGSVFNLDLIKKSENQTKMYSVSSLYTIEQTNLYHRLRPFIDIKNKFIDENIEE